MKKLALWSLTAVLILALGAPVWAASNKRKAELKLRECTLVLDKIMAQSDKSNFLLFMKRAKAIAIFPGVVKAGFIVGGRYGRGVMLARRADGRFGAPVFYEIGGASVGFQIGAQAIDLVLVVKSSKGLNALVKSKVKLGGDVAVAAGPVGRMASADTPATAAAPIVSFSMTKGLFAGVSLKGAGMNPFKDFNRAVYGPGVGTGKILFDPGVKVPAAAAALVAKLNKMAK